MALYGRDKLIDILPIYLTEAILYITLGVAFLAKKRQGIAVFLMSTVWLINQVAIWGATYPLLWWQTFDFTMLNIVLASVQVLLIAVYVYPKRSGNSSTFTYGALATVGIFGVAKMIQTVLAAPAWQGNQYWGYWSFAWGLAITLTAAGYALKLTAKGDSASATMLQVVGTAIAVIVTLGIMDIGLSVI